MKGLTDGGSLVAEKFFKVDVPDGQHLGRVKGSDDDYRGLLFDDDNNLVGHAELNEVDGRNGYAEVDPADQPWESSGRDDEIDIEKIAEGLVALVELAMLLAAAAETAAPHVKRWWNEHGRPTLRSAQNKARAALGKLARQSKKSSDDMSHVLVTVVDHPLPDGSTELIDSYQDLRLTMSSAEAQQRFVAALLAQEFADAQIRLLRGARIEDPEDGSIELESAVRSLTPGQVSEVVQELLVRNPTLIESEKLAEIGRMLNRPGRSLPAALSSPDLEAALGIEVGLDGS
jgi:hypothetical protein